MSTQHWKGTTVPEAGDDLLAAWPTALDTTGVITPASSIAAARVMLSAAESAGRAPTTAHPAYLDIGGILYRADGTKSGSVWRLSPVNENDRFEGSYNLGQTFTRNSGQQDVLITSTIGAAPYDRVFMAWGMAAARVTAGGYRLLIQIRGVDGQGARYESGAPLESQSAFNMHPVPAGVDPAVSLVVRSSASPSTIELSDNAQTNKLMVLAFPVTMA